MEEVPRTEAGSRWRLSDAVVKAVGERKDGHSSVPLELVRDRFAHLLLWRKSQASLTSFCKQIPPEDPIPTYSHFVTELRTRHPDLAFLHVIGSHSDDFDPRVPLNPNPMNSSTRYGATGHIFELAAIRGRVVLNPPISTVTPSLMGGRTSAT